MEILNTLKLDAWWKVVLVCGIALVASALTFDIEIVDRKHLLGLGLGMFLVGISNFAALKTVVIPDKGGYWETKTPIHNRITKVILCIGWGFVLFFGILLFWSLI